MALIQCPECGGKVSDRAPACPHCGFPLNNSVVPAASSATATTMASDQPSAAINEKYAARQGFWRRIPISFVLFWGGMVIGVIGSDVTNNMVRGGVPTNERTLLGWIGWIMIFAGIALFLLSLAKHFLGDQDRDQDLDQDLDQDREQDAEHS